MTPMPDTPRTLVHRRARARSRHPVVTTPPRFTVERVLRAVAVVGAVAWGVIALARGEQVVHGLQPRLEPRARRWPGSSPPRGSTTTG